MIISDYVRHCSCISVSPLIPFHIYSWSGHDNSRTLTMFVLSSLSLHLFLFTFCSHLGFLSPESTSYFPRSSHRLRNWPLSSRDSATLIQTLWGFLTGCFRPCKSPLCGASDLVWVPCVVLLTLPQNLYVFESLMWGFRPWKRPLDPKPGSSH